MAESLEENLKKIEKINKELESAINEINSYDMVLVTPENYGRLLAKRDNLTIDLNYRQNQVIIEQTNEIIKYLKELKK